MRNDAKRQPPTITIESPEVMADLRSAAWLESELHEDLTLHRRHEMADICEEVNIEKIWRVLGLCDAEVRMAIRRILTGPCPMNGTDSIERPERWEYPLAAGIGSETATLVKEKIHDYFVAKAMADRAEVIIPGCAPVWQRRAAEALVSLSECAASKIRGARVRRNMCPF